MEQELYYHEIGQLNNMERALADGDGHDLDFAVFREEQDRLIDECLVDNDMEGITRLQYGEL